MMIARRVYVTGRVQGVFFRAWTREQARMLGVSGWVRNCGDGAVEAQLEGSAEDVEELIEAMREGPPDAEVEDVEAEDTDAEGLSSFEVRH
jgi:acylphosphatase